MATSYNSISHHHLADHLIYLSSSYSFWFSLNSRYDHEFYLSKRLGMSRQGYECLVPKLTGCRTMLFVPVLSLNLLLSLRLNLAPRTTTRCSTKTTDWCVSYSLATDTVMVSGDTVPCPPLSLNLTSALIISLAMLSVRRPHQTASLVILLCLCRRPPPLIVAVDVVVVR